jgi:3-oxoacyl-[acyl-carrier-protein] synthase-1
VPVVTAIGLATAVGPDAPRACAALRAGLSRFAESETFKCRPLDTLEGDLEPAQLAPVRGIPSPAAGLARLVELSLPAIAQAVRGARLTREQFAKAGLHVALPAATRPNSAGWETAFVPELCRRASLPRPAETSCSRAGNSGFAEAVRAANGFLRQSPDAIAIVLCVDSLLDFETLDALEKADRLKCSRQPEGIIAGEAAGTVVLERRAAAERRGANILASIDAVAFGVEKTKIGSGPPNTGDGLVEAVRRVVQSLGAPPTPPWVLSDHNGERHRAQEWAYTMTRCHDVFRDLRHTWYVADSLGDTGAAVGGVLVARAAHAFARSHAPGPQAMVVLSSDDGGRGVVVLGGPESGGD